MSTRTLAGLIICILGLGGLTSAVPALAEEGPTFRILQPTGNQTLAGPFSITVAFQSSDDTPIVRFDAYLDSTLLAGARISNPIPAGSFQVPCDMSKVAITPGAHQLTVKLTDRAGRITQQVQAVTVGGGQPVEHVAPTVRIVAPKDGAGITGSAKVRIEATDDTNIKWVMLYINGQLRMMMNQAPYNIDWDPIKDQLAIGTYTLQARALDAYDNEGVSAPVIVRVLRPSGLTPLETKLPTTMQGTPGIFEVSNIYQPSGGPAIPHQAFSNVIAPVTNWLAGLTQPVTALLSSAPRQYSMPVAASNPLALLPPKSLPGPATMASDSATRSLPTAPVLAWASYQLPRPSLDGQPAASVPALLLPYDPASPRQEIEAGQVPFTALLPEKGWPTIDEQTLYAVPETPTAPTSANKTSVLVALVPGSMMQYTPSQSTALPPADRVLPVKSAPALTADTAVPAVTTAAPITPSDNATLAPPALDGSAAPRPALDTAASALPADASLPTKATPVLTASASTAIPSVPPVALSTAPLPATPVVMASASTVPLPAPSPFTPAPTAVQPPPPTAQATVRESYTVRTDDTLEKVARAFSTTPDALIKLNPDLSPERPLPVNASLTVPSTKARIYMDKLPLTGAVAPFIRNDYTMAPMRSIVEAKDGIVIWLPKSREVNAWVNNTFMNVKIGDRHAQVNTEAYLLPVAPSLLQDRTMVPLRYLMSAMNLHVDVNTASGTYYLASN